MKKFTSLLLIVGLLLPTMVFAQDFAPDDHCVDKTLGHNDGNAIMVNFDGDLNLEDLDVGDGPTEIRDCMSVAEATLVEEIFGDETRIVKAIKSNLLSIEAAKTKCLDSVSRDDFNNKALKLGESIVRCSPTKILLTWPKGGGFLVDGGEIPSSLDHSINVSSINAKLVKSYKFQLKELDRLLEKDRKNMILRTQQKMLVSALSKLVDKTEIPNSHLAVGNNWNLKPALRKDLYGGFDVLTSNTNANDLSLLTGDKAIDESLQLGSIGAERNRNVIGGFGDAENLEKTHDISDLEAVDIESHPWAEMIEGAEFEVPAISRLVPKDVFFVHLKDPKKYLELEKLTFDMASKLKTDPYAFARVSSMRGQFFERLGIKDADSAFEKVEEMAFVSEDLDFYPANDYAVILKLKEGEELDYDNNEAAEIEGYLILATHADLLAKISNTSKKEALSMAKQEDYHFILANLEKRNDGMIYYSEAFIRKLTGPEYRINSRRRNTVINALQDLQYVVFAYKKIVREWPSSFKQISSEGFIQKNGIYEEEKYLIDEEGRVSHKDWGSLWNLTPVDRVEIKQVNGGEKELYERFSEDYQSYFTEFFDPVGISFTVSDRVLFHTIIAPLIEETEYNAMKAAFGAAEPRELDSIFNSRRLGALNLAASFDFESIIKRQAEEKKNRPRGLIATSDSKEDEEDGDEEADPIMAYEEEIAEDLDIELKEGERLLDWIGDEVVFSIGAENSFMQHNIANLDLWLGLKINDQEKAQRLFEGVVKKFGSKKSPLGISMFSVSADKPAENEYNGQKYYLIPTGFVNLYYVYLDDYIYFTISQKAINNLVDAIGVELDVFKRDLAYVDKAHHVLGVLDVSSVNNWGFDQSLSLDWEARSDFEAARQYLSEALIVAKMLPGYDGDLDNVKDYYRNIPEGFMDGKFEVEKHKIYFVVDEKRFEIFDIATSKYLYGAEKEKANKLDDLVDMEIQLDEVKEAIDTLKTAALAMDFTAEGLEVKLSFSNPNVTEEDHRFSYDNDLLPDLDLPGKWYYWAIGGAALLILIIAVFFARRNKMNVDGIKPMSAPEKPDDTIQV